MKKLYLFPICIIACSLLFSGCDEDEDNKWFLLLAGRALMGQTANTISFNTHTVHNYNPETTVIDKDVTMTSADGFVLSGDDYVAEFSDGVDSFEISIPNTVTESSTYDAGDYVGPGGFSSTYIVIIDALPFGQWIFDGYDAPTNFELQVTSLSGGRITATFSGMLKLGTLETLYVNSSLVLGTLSSSIGD
ncbi:MAG: hypothetical protein JW807_10335 [Spirochaetes bacterium]|nr:hypothetical protein [Spirochaetota bacterium]